MRAHQESLLAGAGACKEAGIQHTTGTQQQSMRACGHYLADQVYMQHGPEIWAESPRSLVHSMVTALSCTPHVILHRAAFTFRKTQLPESSHSTARSQSSCCPGQNWASATGRTWGRSACWEASGRLHTCHCSLHRQQGQPQICFCKSYILHFTEQLYQRQGGVRHTWQPPQLAKVGGCLLQWPTKCCTHQAGCKGWS